MIDSMVITTKKTQDKMVTHRHPNPNAWEGFPPDRFVVVDAAREGRGYVAESRAVEWLAARLPSSRTSEVGLGS